MTEAIKTLSEGLVKITSKKQANRDALTKLFYRNAAMNRGIPWGAADEVDSVEPSESQYTSSSSNTTNSTPIAPVPVAAPEKSAFSNILPWALAGLLGAGLLGYGLYNYFDSPDNSTISTSNTIGGTDSTDSSLYQYLEDEGYSVPPENGGVEK